ncbi:MAG: hypothetical protein Tsb0016_24230 [Sphingomonadales bacterium]
MTVITPFTSAAKAASAAARKAPVAFTRAELNDILRIYGHMVAAGQWRDYSIDRGHGQIAFSVYVRASEMPQYRIVKEPALAARQGAFRLVGPSGAILKRGHELASALKPLAAKLLKLVE